MDQQRGENLRRGAEDGECFMLRENGTLHFVRCASVANVILSQKLIYGLKMFRVKRLGKVWKL